MPRHDKAWFHVTFGTYASWLQGDPRGFRTRNHRQHSSGDHRNRPPRGEHAGLHKANRDAAPQSATIARELRPLVGERIVQRLEKLEHELLVIAVGGQHVHLLARLPTEFGAVDHEVGRCKQSVSVSLSGKLPKKLWARGCGVKPIRDRDHQRRAYRYIRDHVDEGAWVWTFRDGELAYDPG